MSRPTPNTSLDLEAAAFDRQIRERVRYGHLPDLRRARACDYFYNNSWRHPAYVQLDFGEIFVLLEEAIAAHGGPAPQRVLEIGCGPGHLSLELARSGHDVTGIDLSAACIEVAEEVASQDPWKATRGPLCYLTGDVMEHSGVRTAGFEAVVLVGTLHHFSDQDAILQRVHTLLSPNGLILVHEPTRDRVTVGNATFVHLLQVLLSLGGGYYQHAKPPVDTDAVREGARQVYADLTYESLDGVKTQSPHDNEAGYAEMLPALRRFFAEIRCEDRYAFFHEVIGGLRFDEPLNETVARSLRAFDAMLCRLGILQPTEFFFVGRSQGLGGSQP